MLILRDRLSTAQTTTEKDEEGKEDTVKGRDGTMGLRWELRHPHCRQCTLADVSYGFSTDCAFPQMQRSCTVDLSFHGNSDPRRLFVWSLTPSVQTLFYTGPNNTESGPKLTKTNQAVAITHPFLRVNQCKCFLIEFPDVSYKINTKNQLQKHKGCK